MSSALNLIIARGFSGTGASDIGNAIRGEQDRQMARDSEQLNQAAAVFKQQQTQRQAAQQTSDQALLDSSRSAFEPILSRIGALEPRLIAMQQSGQMDPALIAEAQALDSELKRTALSAQAKLAPQSVAEMLIPKAKEQAPVMPQSQLGKLGYDKSAGLIDDQTYEAGKRKATEISQGAQTAAPANQRLFEWYAAQQPETQQQYLEMIRGAGATPEGAGAIAGAKTEATEQAKARVFAEQELPKIQEQAQGIRHIIGLLRDSPGLKYIYGMYSLAPVVPGTDQANSIAIWEQLQGKAFLEAFSTLKGGGQITEKEGEKATAAITRLANRKISVKAAMQAMDELEQIAVDVERRATLKAGKGTEPPRQPEPRGAGGSPPYKPGDIIPNSQGSGAASYLERARMGQ